MTNAAVLCGAVAALLLIYLAAAPLPLCDAAALHGARIGGVIRIGGCP